MTEDPTTPGVLWVGTIGGGLNRFDLATETFSSYTTANTSTASTTRSTSTRGRRPWAWMWKNGLMDQVE